LKLRPRRLVWVWKKHRKVWEARTVLLKSDILQREDERGELRSLRTGTWYVRKRRMA
jgi:hypothetical protein